MITHIVGKTLVFNEEGKLLLLKRSSTDNHRPGGLDLPGGKIDDDQDEEIVAGTMREALEEAGLTIDPNSAVLVYADTVVSLNSDINQKVSMTRLTFAATVSGQEVKLSHEHDGYSWHDIDEAIKLTSDLRYKQILEYLKENDIVRSMWAPGAK